LLTNFPDKNISTLALTSCFFEGSLFLFIFFKFPALKLCHETSGAAGDLPFGLIFAILMCSMMFGSQLYNHIIASATTTPVKNILIGTLAAASLCFFLPAYVREESVTLWCFCIFEVCCGVYFPAMASLRGKLIDDGSRASVYTILRVPLNAFVVLALSTTREGMFNPISHVPTLRPLTKSQANTIAIWYSLCAPACYCSQRWSFAKS
jgi:hypothetical protein